MKVTIEYDGAPPEEIVLNNGEHFADYVGEIDVPGSKLARGVAISGQMRFFTLTPQRREVIQRLVLESVNPRLAPVVAAITAELGNAADEANVPQKSTAAAAAKAADGATPTAKGTLRVLLAGGGSAHDFQRWFNQQDVATLKNAGFAATYTDSPEVAARELPNADAFVMSTNQPQFSGIGFRKAISDFLDAGTGVVFLHAGVWYNFKDWPEFNKQLIGGGARGHDRLGEFEVSLTKPDHPVLAGLPPNFKIVDELYYVAAEQGGSPMVTLAKTSVSQGKQQEHASIWTVPHTKGRILCIALGHDGRAHELAEFKKLLVNGVTWAAGKAD
jgi:type 1 glutamine amidotransferase